MKDLSDLDCEYFKDKVIAIRGAEKPLTGIINHAFLILLDETDKNNPVILDELHFVPGNEQGDSFVGIKSLVSNLINMFVSITNLEARLKSLAEFFNLQKDLFYLKPASYKSGNRKLSEINTVVYDRGCAGDILNKWNNAYRISVEIKKRNYLFTLMDFFIKPARNCRAGQKAIVEGLGYRFISTSENGRNRGDGSNLIEDIKGRFHFKKSSNIKDLIEQHRELKSLIGIQKKGYGLI